MLKVPNRNWIGTSNVNLAIKMAAMLLFHSNIEFSGKLHLFKNLFGELKLSRDYLN